MTVTSELSPAVHNGPQFSRLRRSPSPHPCVIPVTSKSNFKKTIEAVKNGFKTPCETIKHCFLFESHRSDSVARQYPNRQPSTLKTFGAEDGDGYHYQIGLRSVNHQDGLSEDYSSEDEDHDEGNDSGVDVSEDMASMLQEKLWVVSVSGIVKDGGACAWWKM